MASVFGAGRGGRRSEFGRRRPTPEILEGRQLLASATIYVTSTGDADGADGGSTLSFRQAIEISDGTLAVSSLTSAQQALVIGDPTVVVAPPNLIIFAIPGAGPFTIAPSSPLPAVTSPLMIDGYTESTAHPNTNGPGQADNEDIEVGLDFSHVPATGAILSVPVGLTISSPYCVVEGLAIGGMTGGVGISLYNSNSTAGDAIFGDFIGTDTTGTKALPNGTGIVSVDPANSIGGATPDSRNVISGNSGAGIRLANSFGLVQGNLIGTDPTGTKAVPNGTGIELMTATSNTIGGTAAGAGNVISGNAGAGVEFDYGVANAGPGISIPLASIDNLVQGNFIGTDLTGQSALPNTGSGVTLNGGPSNTIGGTAVGAANVIAFNAGAGVDVPVSKALPNYNNAQETISGNSIFGNVGLGIDLGSGDVYPNNPSGDPNGPNLLQPYPVLKSATVGASGTTIAGTLDAAPSTRYTVELFANPAPEPSSYGQGETYLGSTTATTDASGHASFVFIVPANLAGQSLSATATDLAGNTSEFAADLTATTGGTPPPVTTSATTTILIGPTASSAFGQGVPLAAEVATTPGVTPTGMVLFGSAGVILGEAPVNAQGVALLYTNLLPPGVDVVAAAYIGDATTSASLSNYVAVEVTPAPPTVALFGPSAATQAGQPVTLTATVEPAVRGGAKPTGKVEFGEDGVILGEAPVDASGRAVFVTKSLPAGSNVISAVYLGDASSPASLSNYVAVDVTPKAAKSSVTVKTKAKPVKATSGGKLVATHPVGPSRAVKASKGL